ncbi:MAG: pyridine nucleotide-disulfide oxidoreductase, partial [bacterium]|nr:pyridine nucleotide-disulfide oxidoreductase [Candidatus Kapabacteria bacterium]
MPGYTYTDLYDPLRLRELFEVFRTSLRETDAVVSERYERYLKSRGADLTLVEISEVIVDTAPHVAAFIVELFQVRDEHGRMRRAVEDESVVFVFKREFVVRRALKRFRTTTEVDAEGVRAAVDALMRSPLGAPYASLDTERAMASFVVGLMNLDRGLRAATVIDGTLADDARAVVDALRDASSTNATLATRIPAVESVDESASVANALLELLDEWVAVEHYSPSVQTRDWVSLKLPHTLDYANLVELRTVAGFPAGAFMGPPETYRNRDGFALTDARYDHRHVLDEVHYCIFCHERDKDSCSKGLLDKEALPKRNPLGIVLEGCPLDEKISEMHVLKARGDGLAALAVITIDNPLCAGTGHRICNDCMKACIYQKQEPVNIPQAETGVLTEILAYPFGFEIYAFLTRWNPLNVGCPYPR